MGIAELILVALALSMDAFAVGLTNGMTERKMKISKMFLIAAFYGFFQFIMPLIGYYASGLLSSLIERIAPWLSFILLAFIGGKMVIDGIKEMRERNEEINVDDHAREDGEEAKPLHIRTLTAQAIATSIDALAVGVTFLALETSGTLCLNVWLDCLIIGVITFTLSMGAVFLGKIIGNKLADKAEIFGGAVLIVIGIKILVEGLGFI